MTRHQSVVEEDMDLVAVWLRRDPVRWVAGALAGAFAGFVAVIVAMGLSVWAGLEFWYPIKVAALPLLGGSATEFGPHWPAILVGIATIEVICVFWGVIYAHFTGTNHVPSLLGIGVTFGLFSWIFIFNLFSQSVAQVNAMNLSRGAGLPIMLAYGISLTAVAMFDRVVRGRSL